jgi:hypothetical protein
MSAALKIPTKVTIPEPAIALGTVGKRLWNDTITAFDGWADHELRTLNIACLALQEVHDITAELAAESDFKARRQLRADRNAAGNEFRKQMRELSLSAAPSDSRPPRIAGRYSSRA